MKPPAAHRGAGGVRGQAVIWGNLAWIHVWVKFEWLGFPGVAGGPSRARWQRTRPTRTMRLRATSKDVQG